MPELLELHICFDKRGREIEILEVTRLDRNKYRIEETPIFNQGVSLGDIILVRENQGIYYYLETVRKSELKRHVRLLSQAMIESAELAVFKQKLARHQGKYEQIFGGLFIVHLPVNSVLDVNAELDEISRRFGL